MTNLQCRDFMVTGLAARREMPVATELAIVNMRLKAGAIREMHWHKETEWGSEADRVAGAGRVPKSYSHRLMDQKPVATKGDRVRIVDSAVFPATTTISAALVEVEPGGMRELHWHPDSDELQYYLEGRSRMTVYASGSAAGTFDYQPGDVGYVPRSMPHDIENTGDSLLRYLEVWKSPWFSDVPLRQSLAFTPFELVRTPPEHRSIRAGPDRGAEDARGAGLTAAPGGQA